MQEADAHLGLGTRHLHIGDADRPSRLLEDWGQSPFFAGQLSDLLRKGICCSALAYSPQAYNVGWNAGPIAGQDIAHAHLHVIPRFSDEPMAGIRFWLKQPNIGDSPLFLQV
ncbi:MAG: HIT domain-containing protein [Acidobacteriota bacterium]